MIDAEREKEDAMGNQVGCKIRGKLLDRLVLMSLGKRVILMKAGRQIRTWERFRSGTRNHV